MRELMLAHISLFASDDGVFVRFARAALLDDDLRAETDDIFLLVVGLNFCVLHEILELPDALFGRSLEFARFLVFRVLRKIAERTRVFEILRYFSAADSFEVLKLFRNLVELLLRNDGVLRVSHVLKNYGGPIVREAQNGASV